MNRCDIGDRIIVLGCSGSGKSTLAVKLQGMTGLPLIHLDNIWWKADRTHITREEFDRKLQEILSGEKWIIDGDYSRTYEPRFVACDTVIFLDYPEEVCMEGITERVGKQRRDIPWTENKLDPELVKLVQKYHAENRPTVYALIRKYPGKKIIIFENRQQKDDWLTKQE